MSLLEDLHRTHALTFIYVTHNLAFAERGDRILKFEKGRLKSDPKDSDPQEGALPGSSRLPDGNEGSYYV